MTSSLEFVSGLYMDSVALMTVSSRIASMPGVRTALIAMSTSLNLDLAANLGFVLTDGIDPNQLMIALQADDPDALERARREVTTELNSRTKSRGGQSAAASGRPAPRTTMSAAAQSGARVALVSVPGEHAFVEAMDALRAGMSVMVFSDNVSVEQEVLLKREGRARGLLVMGPDCGTTILAGKGLGFANQTRPGPVGLVSASGTGAQQLICLLDSVDIGISQCLGVGGRDLSASVEGSSTEHALGILDADPDTELIVVLSKPPDPAVAQRIRAAAEQLRTPTLIGFLGPGEPDLSELAEMVAASVGRGIDHWPTMGEHPEPTGSKGLLRGVFSGGTLCAESVQIAAPVLGAIRTNLASGSHWRLGDPDDDVHLMLDYGADEMTLGRPHPMLDHSLRIDALRAASSNHAVSVILLDVVLGHGAHGDPSAELAPAIGDALGRNGLAVVVTLLGTRDDPQDVVRQAEAFAAAGALVFASNAQATRTAVTLASGSHLSTSYPSGSQA